MRNLMFLSVWTEFGHWGVGASASCASCSSPSLSLPWPLVVVPGPSGV